MPLATIKFDIQGAGLSIQKTVERTGNTILEFELALPVGTTGTVKIRNGDSDANFETDGAVASIAVNDTVDVYWSTGVRYGMNVDAKNGGSDSFDITGGAGDALPAQATDIVLVEQVAANLSLDGDNANLVAVLLDDAAGGSGAGHADFQDVGNNTIAELDLVANVPQQFDLAAGIANPFTGAVITHVQASNGSSTNAATLRLIAIVEN